MVGPSRPAPRSRRSAPNTSSRRGYMELSGTSFAAPIVAGAAADMLALHPDWTPDQVKGALMVARSTDPARADPFGRRGRGVRARRVGAERAPEPEPRAEQVPGGLEKTSLPSTTLRGSRRRNQLPPGTASPGSTAGTTRPGHSCRGAMSPGATFPGATFPGATFPGAMSRGRMSPGATSPGPTPCTATSGPGCRRFRSPSAR